MSFTSVNPVSVGLATKVDHYDAVFENTVALRAGEIAVPSLGTGDIVTGASSTQLGRVANAADATKFLNGAATPAYAQVKDSDLSTSDVTTNNASTSKHGFLKKLSNVTTEFMRGDGAWAAAAVPGLQGFRGLRVSTSPDTALAATTVRIDRIDEASLDDGSIVSDWNDINIDITASGVNGLDSGTEGNAWYEVYGIYNPGTDTRAGLLHLCKNRVLEEAQSGKAASQALKFDGNTAKLAQGFISDGTAGPVEYVDLTLTKQAAPTGSIWLEIQSDTAGAPSGTVLATSDKLDVTGIHVSPGVSVRFVFRSPFSVVIGTQYHLVIQVSFAADGTNWVNVLGSASNTYAGGVLQKYDGAAWSAASAVVDAWFNLYVTRNDTAVTMPSGYTGKVLLGYVLNSTDLIPFVQQERSVQFSPARAVGTFTNVDPVLTAMDSFLPPVPVTAFVSVRNSGAALVHVGGIPRGFRSNTATLDGKTVVDQGVSLLSGESSYNGVARGEVATEMSGMYLSTESAGTANAFIHGFRW